MRGVNSLLLAARRAVGGAYRSIRPALWKPERPVAYGCYDLRQLDYRYWQMYAGHRHVHESVAREASALVNQGRVLEVACGAGWNAHNWVSLGLEYWGLDISETALAVAQRRAPECRFINAGILDVGFIQDAAFDVIYNSSMLEHIGYAEQAIREMARLARRHLYVVFFEGLGECDSINFTPYDTAQVDGRQKDIYGRKVVLQDHRATSAKGYYWNRYARLTIAGIARDLGFAFELLDRSNRAYVQGETVLHIVK